jgi:hypothetical protein
LYKGKQEVYEKKSKRLIQRLGEKDESKQLAATLLSKCGSGIGGFYLGSNRGSESDIFYSPSEFIATLRNHLGGGLTNHEPVVRTRPQGGNTYETRTNKCEALSCVLNAPLRTHRHTEINTALCRLIKSVYPGDHVEKDSEKTVVGKFIKVHQGRENIERDVRADIVWMQGPNKWIIDVSIVTPEAQKYINHPYLSHVHQDAAAKAGEARKRVHYSKVNQVNGEPGSLPENSIIPFVMESTGRLGPAAFSFLNKICGVQTYKRSSFLKDCALLCARYIGKMTVATRVRFETESPFGG